jgi:hypothetical protein
MLQHHEDAQPKKTNTRLPGTLGHLPVSMQAAGPHLSVDQWFLSAIHRLMHSVGVSPRRNLSMRNSVFSAIDPV